jgi:hypothetical protein
MQTGPSVIGVRGDDAVNLTPALDGRGLRDSEGPQTRPVGATAESGISTTGP